ncbi:MAG: hypothetical protein ABIY50_10915 [Ignavibacteria bacterium]
MEENRNSPKPPYREINEENDNYREKNKLTIPLVIAGVVLLLLIMYFAMSGDSNYDRGLKYLKQQQYTEALVEFQKVDTDEKEFRMAQSKINYINGLLTYKEGNYPQSKLYLTKVEPSDEYYREARLMIDKMDLASKQGNLELLTEQLKQDKDTVIIKERVIEKQPDKVGGAETRTDDTESIRKYRTALESISGKFEALYQTAKSASVPVKKEYVTDMDSLYSEFQKFTSGQSSGTTELRQLANSWMQKRMSHINRLIAENSVSDTKSTMALKEEGDKDYRLLQSMIRNN